MRVVQEILKEVCRNIEFYSIKELTEDRYKRFAELSIMFGYVRPYAEENYPLLEKTIKEFLITQMSRITTDRIFKNYYISYHLILPYVSIREFHKIPHLEHCLEIIINDKMLSSEIPPHRQMEWSHMIGKIGKTSYFETPTNSILNRVIYTQFLSRELTYGITHALFYITDFGAFSPDLSTERLRELEFILGSLIAKTSQEYDIDLMLELTINYLSLSERISIDFSILELVYDALQKTSFVKFHLDQDQTIKKYHTYFVLTILCIRLRHILDSDTQLTSHQQEMIQSIIDQNGDGLKEEEFSDNKFEHSWRIIESLKNKNFNFDEMKKYHLQWGFSPQLYKEVERYIDFLQERAKRNILWQEECAHLGLDKNNEEQLNQQLIQLLSKEKLQLKRYSLHLNQKAV